MRAAYLKALPGILLIISVFAQEAHAQSFAQWVARALDAESQREYGAAREAYHHAQELRPLDVVLNMKLYSLTGDRAYLLRAAEGLLQEPHPQHELVEQICDLLMNHTYFVEYNTPLPLTLLPAEKRKAFMQRFAKWLFPDLLTEARYYLITNEREKAVSIMRRIALCGEPFALDELLWGPPAKRDDWRRQIAEQWEREALKTKHPCLFVAVLNMYWHLQDLPSIRRVFPHALAATQGDKRYRQLLAICMHRIGWEEGMAKVPLQQEEASDDPIVLERQLMEAARRRQTERARRLFLRCLAEVPGWTQSLSHHTELDLLSKDPAEAPASADEENIAEMLVRYLQQPERFRYWLKVAVVRGTQLNPPGSTPTDVLVGNFLCKIPPDYVVAVIDKALPLLGEMGLPEPLLKSQTEALQQHRIDAYSRLGYSRLVQKLYQRTTGGFPTENGWRVIPVDGGWTVQGEQPGMDSYTVVGGQVSSLSVKLLEEVLHRAYTLVKEGRSREAGQVASAVLSQYPEWREGLVRAVAFFEKGIPAIVPFAQWLSKVAAKDESLVRLCYEMLEPLAGEELAQAVLVAVLAVFKEPESRMEQTRLHIHSILYPEGYPLRSLVTPSPPLSPPRVVELLAEYLRPDLWDSRFFTRLGSPWTSQYHTPFVRRYPDAAACVLHRLWQTALTHDKNAVRQGLRLLRKARHWHTVDWLQLPQLASLVRGVASAREALELVDIAFVHAPKAFHPALQRAKIALRANPPDALPLDVQVEMLTEVVLKQPMPAQEKIEDLRTVAFTNPEAVTTVLERLLPDLMMNDSDNLYRNNLLWRYCRTLSDIAEREPQLASRLYRLFEKAVSRDVSLKYSMAYERASLASLVGKEEQSLQCLLQASSVETPGVVSGASLLFRGMVKIPLSPEGYRHLQEALQEWLRKEAPSLTRITNMLQDIPSYGVAIVYTDGRKTYHGTASETGLRMLAEALIDYVRRFPGVIPKSFADAVIVHARHVYSRDDVAGAAPAWKQLMHASLRDIILLSPEDARSMAENLRIFYLSSSAYDIPETFRKEITEIIGLLQSGGERS